MNTRKLWRALCATILCVALLCGMAVAEDDITLEIDAINTAEEDVTVELDGDENNTEPGTAKATLTGKGNYTGTKKISFKVGSNLNPKGTCLTKVKGGRKQIQVKWKKNKKVTGYQIAYSLTKDFAIWEDKIVRDPKKTGVTIKGLKSKTTYYVRIRTYKRLNGRRHWSPWSDSMKVKTK